MAGKSLTHQMIVAEATPTVDTSAYATGDCIDGKLEFTVATRGDPLQALGGSGIIESVVVTDRAKQDVALDLVLFDSDPASTTFTDNAALDIDDADLPNIVAVVNLLAADYDDFADNSVVQQTELAIPFVLDAGTTLFGVLVARGAPTYVASTDLHVKIGILQT